MDPTRIFPDQYLPNLAGGSAYDKWKAANSGPNGDYTKWVAFRDKALQYKKGDAKPASPTMATKNGRQLVAAAELHMSVTDIGSVYPGTQPTVFTTNIVDGQAISLPFLWTASVTPAPTSVQFFADGVLLRTVIAPPYECDLGVLADGSHQLGLCASYGSVQNCYDPFANNTYFAQVTVSSGSALPGVSLERFSGFKNAAFGPDSAYPGSGAIFNRKCNPAPSSNGFDNQGVVCPLPWSDGWSGIFEITDPTFGDGLDFRFGPSMPRSSGHGLQIADIHHILNGFPVDFDLEWDIIFPAAGNPNGFPPFPGDPSTDEWNVIIEFTDAGFQSNGIGIANYVAPKPKFYVTAGIGIDNQKRSAKSSFTIQMDKLYHFHYRGRLSKGSDGWLILDITPAGAAAERVANWTGPTSNPADGGPYVELGQYGMNVSGTNQMKIFKMRNLLG